MPCDASHECLTCRFIKASQRHVPLDECDIQPPCAVPEEHHIFDCDTCPKILTSASSWQ